jgi:hypothetical protein
MLRSWNDDGIHIIKLDITLFSERVKESPEKYFSLSDYTPACRQAGIKKNDSTEILEGSGLFQKSLKIYLTKYEISKTIN